jgi:RNA polymerase sigma factor (TIGR02999 family)
MPLEVTELLQAWSQGDVAARDRLFPLVYQELRRRASDRLRRERPGHTLQATALVHEAYLRLLGQRAPSWQNRSQFFAIASQMMRRILVDHARARRASKRQGQRIRLELNEDVASSGPREVDLIALDQALNDLTALDPRQGRMVELRFFAGLSHEEVAEVLGLSPATVKREWRVARAWLFQRVAGQGGDAAEVLEEE